MTPVIDVEALSPFCMNVEPNALIHPVWWSKGPARPGKIVQSARKEKGEAAKTVVTTEYGTYMHRQNRLTVLSSGKPRMEPIDDLSQDVIRFHDYFIPTRAERRMRSSLLKRLRALVVEIWPKARVCNKSHCCLVGVNNCILKVEVFGSYAADTFLPMRYSSVLLVWRPNLVNSRGFWQWHWLVHYGC